MLMTSKTKAMRAATRFVDLALVCVLALCSIGAGSEGHVYVATLYGMMAGVWLTYVGE